MHAWIGRGEKSFSRRALQHKSHGVVLRKVRKMIKLHLGFVAQRHAQCVKPVQTKQREGSKDSKRKNEQKCVND